MRTSTANALAFQLEGIVMVTTGALETLDDEALEAVLAHELAHLGESRAARWARLAPAVAIGLLVFAGPLSARYGAHVVVLLFASPFVALAALARLRRRAEVHADEAGHAHEPQAGAYARALLRLYEANLVPAVVTRRMVHPSLYDRVLAAGVTPDFPRPQPPSGRPAFVWLLLLGVLTFAGLVGIAGVPPTSPAAAQLSIAFRDGMGAARAWDVLEADAYERGEIDAMLAFLAAAAAATPRARRVARLVDALVDFGRCARAQALAPRLRDVEPSADADRRRVAAAEAAARDCGQPPHDAAEADTARDGDGAER